MAASLFSRLPALPGSVRQWHWISSAFCLVGMLLFAITGITLNHAASIEGQAQITSTEAELTPALMSTLAGRSDGPLPLAVRHWLADQHGIVTGDQPAEWDDGEVYLALPRPGGDAWLSIDLEAATLIYERTDRGWISYLNDLHKGRHTGTGWQWFLDVFAVICVIFSLSGLWLLSRYARQRPGTWPVTLLGALVPVIILILTVH